MADTYTVDLSAEELEIIRRALDDGFSYREGQLSSDCADCKRADPERCARHEEQAERQEQYGGLLARFTAVQEGEPFGS
jgi:hypothetical protein